TGSGSAPVLGAGRGSRLGGLPYVRTHPVDDRRGRRTRREDLRDALLLERRDVRLGDDAAAEDQDVRRVALLEQSDHGGEERVVQIGRASCRERAIVEGSS